VAYFKGLSKEERDYIKYVSIDMWDGYYQAVKEALPKKVKIVIDRFHVMKHLNESLGKCRKEIQKGLTESERELMKGSRWLLVSNEENLDLEQLTKLKDILKKHPNLKKCYNIKEEFREIFNSETKIRKARMRIKTWKKKIRKINIKYLNKFLKTFENWEKEIMNYFSSGKITNGTVEGINNKIKVIKRRGYGYTNIKNFRQRILSECNGKRS
jgi:transposase